jgi:hypothetical protein
MVRSSGADSVIFLGFGDDSTVDGGEESGGFKYIDRK